MNEKLKTKLESKLARAVARLERIKLAEKQLPQAKNPAVAKARLVEAQEEVPSLMAEIKKLNRQLGIS